MNTDYEILNKTGIGENWECNEEMSRTLNFLIFLQGVFRIRPYSYGKTKIFSVIANQNCS